MMNIVFTIKTSYSEENYFLAVDKNKSIETQIGEALAEICFCDDYEIVSYKEVDESYAEERNRLIEKYEELFNESVAEAFLSGKFVTVESLKNAMGGTYTIEFSKAKEIIFNALNDGMTLNEAINGLTDVHPMFDDEVEYLYDYFKNVDLFEVGDTFTTTCIFTGGSHVNKVVRRDANRIFCECVYEEMDGTHKVTDSYEVRDDEFGEYAVLWEYQGEEGRRYAKDLHREEV